MYGLRREYRGKFFPHSIAMVDGMKEEKIKIW
jgi:hypothetical protein